MNSDDFFVVLEVDDNQNAPLHHFQIELLGWKLQDLSPQSNGSILREIVQKSASRSTPNDGARVTGKKNANLLIFEFSLFSSIFDNNNLYHFNHSSYGR